LSRHDRTVVSDPVVFTLVRDRKILDAPTKRRTWENSRLVVQEDGSTVPVLVLLANHVFGPWDPQTHYPVWKDKDYCNESPENVQLVEKSQFGPRRKNPYGVPAGTREYWRKYREANRARLREVQQQHYARRKQTVKEAETLKQENERLRGMLPAGEAATGDRVVETLNERLKDIIGDHR
jgi:hypothetical protein